MRWNPSSSSESFHAPLVSEAARGAPKVGSAWPPASGVRPTRAPERHAANDMGGLGGEEEKAGVKRARNGLVPERSNGSSEGEGGHMLEGLGSVLTFAVRLSRDEGLRLGVARGVRKISRGGVDFRVDCAGWRGRNGWRRQPLSSPSLAVCSCRSGRRALLGVVVAIGVHCRWVLRPLEQGGH